MKIVLDIPPFPSGVLLEASAGLVTAHSPESGRHTPCGPLKKERSTEVAVRLGSCSIRSAPADPASAEPVTARTAKSTAPTGPVPVERMMEYSAVVANRSVHRHRGRCAARNPGQSLILSAAKESP